MRREVRDGYEEEALQRGDQTRFKKPTLATPSISGPMPQSEAQRIAASTRILEPSKSVTLFIFISSPVRENSASQIPYASSQRARANDVCKT